MTIYSSDLIYAVEGSLLTHADYPENLVRWLMIDGISGRYSPNLSHPLLNMIGCTRLDETTVEAAIQEVKQHFDKLGSMMRWLISDFSTPSNINQYLEDAGFTQTATLVGMILKDLHHQIKSNSTVTVREATTSDSQQLIGLYRDAYPLPQDVAEIALEMFNVLGARHYLAYLADVPEPVSVASMFYYPNTRIVALQGAATLPEFRGRGIYTSLMARRLDDARADNMQLAVMQAHSTTSAPIVANLGFEKLCDMVSYTYSGAN